MNRPLFFLWQGNISEQYKFLYKTLCIIKNNVFLSFILMIEKRKEDPIMARKKKVQNIIDGLYMYDALCHADLSAMEWDPWIHHFFL